MIRFNQSFLLPNSMNYITDVLTNTKIICGDGKYTFSCNKWFEDSFNIHKVLLTTSCTHALEMTAMLADIMPGDEIITSAYTFVSTVNAFILKGAKVVFVDIRPDTMNIDEKLIENAVTDKTKAIVPVHYAGVSCEMDEIMRIAKKYNLLVIEDAAQGVMATYKGNALGSIGDFGCYSFHETKNYTMGEGGAILINRPEYAERAEIIREKGTNRSKFFRGMIDKYTWVDVGSSYLPSEINAAYLYSQLECANEINNMRLAIWNNYYEGLGELEREGFIELPYIPIECGHNAHMFYIKCKDIDERERLISHLKSKEITAVFHYIPLHNCEISPHYTQFAGRDNYTTRESERILRLPLYCELKESDVQYVIDTVVDFYHNKSFDIRPIC